MKLTYEQLAVEVEKVYATHTQENQDIEAASIVSALIQAGGWTEDQYWASWMSYQEGLTA